MDFLYFNKLSELHNGIDIIFCKTDYLYNEFNYIKSLNNDVILITGNSDYPITDKEVSLAPNNIKKWFAQNAISKNKIIEPIPIGLENKLECNRSGHGVSYFERASEKERILKSSNNKTPNKFIYSNFNVNTNYSERIKYKDLSISIDYIDWEEPNLSLNEFFEKILYYKMVLCPIGNGIDTHRLWEILYYNRIPITVKSGDYKIYELYEKLPIIILDNIEDIKNKKLIEEKYHSIIEKNHDNNILNTSYWIDFIKKQLK
jgi:hypothetical protein